MKRLPEFRLLLDPADDRARQLIDFKWAPDEVGKRHKLGGAPDFIQPIEWPICTICHDRMSFYAQLDSLNDEFILADCGLIYVFVCFDDNEVATVLQSG